MKIKTLPSTRSYEDSTGRYYRGGDGFLMYESPVDIYGPVTITGYFLNDPNSRSRTSKALGVYIAPIKDAASNLYLPDGTQCKPNWFEDNPIVLCDSEHRTAVLLRQYGYHRHSPVQYPSPYARPVSGNRIEVARPNIKQGNAVLKWLAPHIGEAKLRAGILQIYPKTPNKGLIGQLANQQPPDLTNDITVAMMIHNDLSHLVRNATKDVTHVTELRYEP